MHFSRGRLRGHRHGQALSAGEVADHAGLSTERFHDIEFGDITPTAAEVEALALALRLLPSELYGEGEWVAEYIDSATTYAKPMTESDIEAAARAIAEGASS